VPEISVNDTTLYVRERGSGPLGLFLPGFLLDSTFWLDGLAGLSDLHRCVAVDLRGHGRSEPTAKADLDIDEYVEDIAQLIRALGEESADIVGFSLGGVLGALLYERYPSLVRSLTLLSVNWTQDDAPYALYRQEMARLVIREGKDALFRRFDEYIVDKNAQLFARARYRSMLETTRHDMIVALLLSAPKMRDFNYLAPQLGCPVLFVVGDGDAIMGPDATRTLAASMPNAEVAVVAGAGRLTPLETPEALNDAIRRFWAA